MVLNERYTFKARIRPNTTLRSILGHTLAARPYNERQEAAGGFIRDYPIHQKPLDQAVQVHVWRFLPKDELVVARDILIGDIANRKYSGTLNVIKFYPMTAAVEPYGNCKLDAVSLSEFSIMASDEELVQRIRFSTPFSPRFSEEASGIDPKYFVLTRRGYSDGIENA